MENPIRSRIADRIRWYRLQRGLSEQELARRADLPLHYVCGIEQARINVTLSALESLAHALGVPAERLFDSHAPQDRD